MPSPISNPESCCSSSSTKLRAWFRPRFSGAASTAGRQATVLFARTATSPQPANLQGCFPRGVDNNSNGYGNQVAVSLPTRWATVVASGYMGADLRFMFAGQLLSNYNQAAGLTQQGERPLGGWLFNRGLWNQLPPAMPWLHHKRQYAATADSSRLASPSRAGSMLIPKGRNAGWQAYYEYGIDAANANDFRYAKAISAEAGGGPIRSELNAITVFYKMNPWVQFGFEESHYASYAVPEHQGCLHHEDRRLAKLHVARLAHRVRTGIYLLIAVSGTTLGWPRKRVTPFSCPKKCIYDYENVRQHGECDGQAAAGRWVIDHNSM